MTPEQNVPHPSTAQNEIEFNQWLITAIVRLETKVDTLVQLERRVQDLEGHRSWMKGALGAAGIFGALMGTGLTLIISMLN